MKASHKKRKQMVGMQMIILEPGDFIFGRKAASKELKISEQTIRTCVQNLKKLQNLTIKVTNKFSVISIINWDSYQDTKGQTNQQINQQLTSNQPATNQQLTTNKNVSIKNVSIEVKKPSSKKAFEGSEQKEEIYKTKKGRALSGKRLLSFESFWDSFGYKSGKAEAADSWLDIPRLTDSLVEQIYSAAKIENSQRGKLREDGKTPKMAQGWITGRRWEDEVYQNKNSGLSEKEQRRIEIETYAKENGL